MTETLKKTALFHCLICDSSDHHKKRRTHAINQHSDELTQSGELKHLLYLKHFVLCTADCPSCEICATKKKKGKLVAHFLSESDSQLGLTCGYYRVLFDNTHGYYISHLGIIR